MEIPDRSTQSPIHTSTGQVVNTTELLINSVTSATDHTGIEGRLLTGNTSWTTDSNGNNSVAAVTAAVMTIMTSLDFVVDIEKLMLHPLNPKVSISIQYNGYDGPDVTLLYI